MWWTDSVAKRKVKKAAKPAKAKVAKSKSKKITTTKKTAKTVKSKARKIASSATKATAKKSAAKKTSKKKVKKAVAKKKAGSTKKTAKKVAKKKASPAKKTTKAKSKPKSTKKKVTKAKKTSTAKKTAGSGKAKATTKAKPVKPPKIPKTFLTKKQLREFKELLLVKRAELVGDVSNLTMQGLGKDGAHGGEFSSMPIHMADLGSDNWEQEFNLDLLANERSLVRQIDETLVRIENRTYGICVATHNPISIERLKAKPWAKYCIEYARRREEGRLP